MSTTKKLLFILTGLIAVLCIELHIAYTHVYAANNDNPWGLTEKPLFTEDSDGNLQFNPSVKDSNISSGMDSTFINSSSDIIRSVLNSLVSSYTVSGIALDTLVDGIYYSSEAIDYLKSLAVGSDGMIKSGNSELGRRLLDKLVSDNTSSSNGNIGNWVHYSNALINSYSTGQGPNFIWTSSSDVYIAGVYSGNSLNLYFAVKGDSASITRSVPGSSSGTYTVNAAYRVNNKVVGYYTSIYFNSPLAYINPNNFMFYSTRDIALSDFFGTDAPSGDPLVIDTTYTNNPFQFRALPNTNYETIYNQNYNYYNNNPSIPLDQLLNNPSYNYVYPNYTFDVPYWVNSYNGNLTIPQLSFPEQQALTFGLVVDDQENEAIESFFSSVPSFFVACLSFPLIFLILAVLL